MTIQQDQSRKEQHVSPLHSEQSASPIVADQQARTEALNPAHSFIVQAPAGSGKTELLTQRYLSLLSQACEFPEEIIAITFTRKAAAEMRDRVISALILAQDPQPPAAAHKQIAWQLARQVLSKDQAQHWRILENPQRLRILTIDSLCAQLSNRLPLLAGSGAPPRIVEDARPYYQQAVRELLLNATPTELLAHLDNNAEKLLSLCVELLGKREQWLPYIIFTDSVPLLRRQLEQGLGQLAHEILQSAQSHLSTDLTTTLLPLLRFAGQNLQAKQSSHALTRWVNQTHFPLPIPENLELWQGLAQSFLTTKGEWRKMIDIRSGFPPKTAEKATFETILAELSDNDVLCDHLRQILQCPPIQYSDSQWEIITALIEMLPLLAAQLQVIFQQNGITDFIELGFSASRALGDAEQPTDLALSLDYRIRHLLVDEFQDTSVAQFKLLEKLLHGWEADDGRSLFLVGDPMQSIYRFRNAEVSLFLRAIQQGIQHIRLYPLKLTVNFRSEENLIHWFNQIFPHIFPKEADLTSGAIPYTSAAAPQAAGQGGFSNNICCYTSTTSAQQSQQIIEIIQRCQQQDPQGKIAVLVRSRTHLREILPALQTAQLKFQAVEIEPLAERSEIQDLSALTRALHHRADRIAWLAVLRAPFCGLALNDLHIIAQAAEYQTIFTVLHNFTQLIGLSADAIQRLQRIVPVLAQALANRGRLSLAESVEDVWLALGGPAGINHAHELLNTEAFFALLRQAAQNHAEFNISAFTQKLEKLYAAPDTQADERLQIMTIHKAKGLEFDHVILPELQRKPIAENNRLLLWMERANAEGGSDLILAPIKSAAEDSDPMYAYLKEAEQQKLLYEAERVLYVAATRAKHSLHLLAILPKIPDIKAWQPAKGSFLAMLWPYFQRYLPEEFAESPEIESAPSAAIPFQRLVADWQFPILANNILGSAPSLRAPAKQSSSHLDQNSVLDCLADARNDNRNALIIGTVIHEALAELAQLAPDFSRLAPSTFWERRLLQLGLPAAHCAAALETISRALQNIQQDSRGLWILSAEHREQKNEYALSAFINNQLTRIVIDRTFIDAAGIRWIIDYKTGEPSETELNSYHQQLTLYAQIIALQDPRPIRLGLYFPLRSLWQELTGR